MSEALVVSPYQLEVVPDSLAASTMLMRWFVSPTDTLDIPDVPQAAYDRVTDVWGSTQLPDDLEMVFEHLHDFSHGLPREDALHARYYFAGFDGKQVAQIKPEHLTAVTGVRSAARTYMENIYDISPSTEREQRIEADILCQTFLDQQQHDLDEATRQAVETTAKIAVFAVAAATADDKPIAKMSQTESKPKQKTTVPIKRLLGGIEGVDDSVLMAMTLLEADQADTLADAIAIAYGLAVNPYDVSTLRTLFKTQNTQELRRSAHFLDVSPVKIGSEITKLRRIILDEPGKIIDVICVTELLTDELMDRAIALTVPVSTISKKVVSPQGRTGKQAPTSDKAKPHPAKLQSENILRVAITLAEQGRPYTLDDADPSNIDEADWRVNALCAQTDPEAFFPEKGGSTKEAKKICMGCDVRSQCLITALDNDERFGIWGGLSERERRRLKRSAA